MTLNTDFSKDSCKEIQNSKIRVLPYATDRFISTLTRAFRNEPHNAWIFRKDSFRDKAVANYLNIYLREIAKTGAVFLESEDGKTCAVVGSSVDADHNLSLSVYLRLIPAVVVACGVSRVHRMLAMEYALSKAHGGNKQLPHLVFLGGDSGDNKYKRRLYDYIMTTFPKLVAETADPRVAAIARRYGAVETGRVKTLFGGPEMIFMFYDREKYSRTGASDRVTS